MATRNIEINYKTDSGYDVLLPRTNMDNYFWKRSPIEPQYEIQESDLASSRIYSGRRDDEYYWIFFNNLRPGETGRYIWDSYELVTVDGYSDIETMFWENADEDGNVWFYAEIIDINVENMRHSPYIKRANRNESTIIKGESGIDDTYDIQNVHVLSVTTRNYSDDVWTFLQSTNINEYPKNINQDGYSYVFLNDYQNLIKNSTKTQIGTYIGTGTYGESNPSQLSFSFNVKAVFITYGQYGILYNTTSGAGVKGQLEIGSLFIKNQGYAYWFGQSSNASSSPLGQVVWDTFSVKWYSNTEEDQLNIADCQYYYLAIGD